MRVDSPILIKDLINEPSGKLFLSRLQAGRIEYRYSDGYVCNLPNRLSSADLDLLLDEYVTCDYDDDVFYCSFVKSEKAICSILYRPLLIIINKQKD